MKEALNGPNTCKSPREPWNWNYDKDCGHFIVTVKILMLDNHVQLLTIDMVQTTGPTIWMMICWLMVNRETQIFIVFYDKNWGLINHDVLNDGELSRTCWSFLGFLKFKSDPKIIHWTFDLFWIGKHHLRHGDLLRFHQGINALSRCVGSSGFFRGGGSSNGVRIILVIVSLQLDWVIQHL